MAWYTVDTESIKKSSSCIGSLGKYQSLYPVIQHQVFTRMLAHGGRGATLCNVIETSLGLLYL